MTDRLVGRRSVLAAASALFPMPALARLAANERITVGFIGLGAMGSSNLRFALQTSAVQPVAVCDVYQPHLDRAVETAKKVNVDVRAIHDFREILADRSIDAVCISTPDHWHAYMTVEACKAGKDVYIEKPACVYVGEGQKMVQAARKYSRIVQAGTMQRSGGYFRKAAELVKSGAAGDITFCHAFQSGTTPKAGWGNPPDSDPPEGLDWDMWLGPARQRPFNLNRWGVKTATFPTFRYFWDYAGGSMTDWGVHLIDPLHQCFEEVMPVAVTALGSKFFVTDNSETPDTMQATFHYPNYLGSYESRTCNPLPMFGLNQGAGTTIHGTEATIFVCRSGCWLIPNGKSAVATQSWENDKTMQQMNLPHWQNFAECIRSRSKPTSEIETCVRSSTVCILANLAMRFGARLDWQEAEWGVKQESMRPALQAQYRSPWKLEV
jgi:predicted dehydrogenase